MRVGPTVKGTKRLGSDLLQWAFWWPAIKTVGAAFAAGRTVSPTDARAALKGLRDIWDVRASHRLTHPDLVHLGRITDDLRLRIAKSAGA